MSFHKVPILVMFLILLLALVVPVSATLQTFYAYNDTSDGVVGRLADGDWATIRDGAGDTVALTTSPLTAKLTATTSSNTYTSNYRFIFTADTSSIPDSATINSADIYIYVGTKNEALGTMNFSIVSCTPANPVALVAGDYQTMGSTRYIDDVPYASISATTRAAHAGNAAFLSAINKTGYTTFMVTKSADLGDMNPTWASGAVSGYAIGDSSDSGAQRPYIVVNFTAPATVASFTTDIASGTTAVYPDTIAVQFTDTTSGSTPTAWNWSFSDGTYSNLQNPTYTFSNIQSFRVRLNASTSYDSNISEVKDIYQIYEPLINSFNLTNSALNITANDTSSGFNTGSVWTLANSSAFSSARNSMGSFNVNDQMLVITGGNTGSAVNATYYSYDGFNWTLYGNAAFPARFHFGRYSFNNKYYITGGSTNTVYLNDTWESDDAINWTLLNASAAWTKRYEQRYWVSDGKMWTYGLYGNTSTGGLGYLPDLWSSTDGNVWDLVSATTTFGNYPIVLIHPVAGVFAAVGYPSAGYATSPVYAYTSADGITWTLHSKTEITDVNWPGLLHDDKVWSFGGGDATGPTGEVWFTANGTHWFPKRWNAEFPDVAMTVPESFQGKMWLIGGRDAISGGNYLNTIWYSPNVLYNWSWGDGTTNGTTKNATHTYASAGEYTVCLQVQSILTNQTCQNVTVGGAVIPAASFTTNVTSGTVPLAIAFTDTSTNTPTDWDWYINNVKFSDLQNPEYTFTDAGVYDISLYAANGASGDWENKTGYIIATNWYDLQCENQTGNISINLFSNSTSSLGWNWDDPVNITKIAEDGLYVLTFDNSSDYFIGTGYSSESWHKLKIYNETDFGQLNCTTDAVPVTPTPIPIMPSTESIAGSINLIQYWWIVAGVLGIIILFKRG